MSGTFYFCYAQNSFKPPYRNKLLPRTNDIDSVHFLNSQKLPEVSTKQSTSKIGFQQSANDLTVTIEKGWNLISLPFEVDDARLSALFPDAVSPAYSYDHRYLSNDTLLRGVGYWIKFDSAETISIEGVCMCADTINIKSGWNLIGGAQRAIPINIVTTIPSGIINPHYYSYKMTGGYTMVDTLFPGKSYWVKSSQDGLMIQFTNIDSIEGDWTVPKQISFDSINASWSQILNHDSSIFVLWQRGSFRGVGVGYARSTNNGCTWANPKLLIPPDGDNNTSGISITSSGNWIYVDWPGTLPNFHSDVRMLRSSDFGKSWLPQQNMIAMGSPYKITAIGNEVYLNYVSETNGKSSILYSDNNGETFSLLPPLPNIYEPHIPFEGFVATPSGLHGTESILWDSISKAYETYYFHSKNYGMTWDSTILLSSPDFYNSNVFDLTADGDSDVYATWLDGKYGGFWTSGTTLLRRSTNGGLTFEPEQLLTSQKSRYSSISVKDSIVILAWDTDEDGGLQYSHIYVSQSYNKGVTFLPYSRLEQRYYKTDHPDVVIGKFINISGTLIDSNSIDGQIFFMRSSVTVKKLK